MAISTPARPTTTAIRLPVAARVLGAARLVVVVVAAVVVVVVVVVVADGAVFDPFETDRPAVEKPAARVHGHKPTGRPADSDVRRA